MKICVLGGTGNISTSIVRLLLDQGHEIVCANRGRSGAPLEGARWLQIDRHERASFEAAMQAEKFDAAIDMICFSAEEAHSSLRAFRDVGVFVQCSTVCTYGVDYDWYPVTEDHPLRPITGYGRNKAAADAVYLSAYYSQGFPVVILKPSTTYGPVQGLLRQIAPEFSWIDRIRKGKPILVCGDGNALHQHMHVDDAAQAFVGVLQQPDCIGQSYNLVRREFISWADYHRTAMDVIGRQVELVGVPFENLKAFDIPGFSLCEEIFAHHCYYSPEKLCRDLPDFRPQVSLEAGMLDALEALDRQGRIPDSDQIEWEDAIIAAQKQVHPGRKD